MFTIGLRSLYISVAILTLKTILRHDSIDTKEDQLKSVYDFIVVGSGTAGCVVANRLAENGVTRVLLLEAGPTTGVSNDIPSQTSTITQFNSMYDWNYTMAKQKVGLAFVDEVIPDNRGFAIGGSSSINTMIFNRGNRRTFDVWAQHYGADGWSYDEVLPYFKKWEKNTDPYVVHQNPGYHGTDGPVKITTHPNNDPLMELQQQYLNREAGFPNIDINGPTQVGTTMAQAFIGPNGVRSSSSNEYIDPNPYPHNLHILSGSLVTRVLFEDKRAVGVVFERKGQRFKVFARKEVILSTGAFNSPQLLMLSGIGPKEHLRHIGIPVLSDIPVGDNLQNHPGIDFNFVINPKSLHLVNIGGQLNVNQLYQWFTKGSGPLAANYRSLAYFSTKSNTDKEWPNVGWESALYLFPQTMKEFTVFQFGKRLEEWKQYMADYWGRYYLFVHPILQRPRSRGTVRLSSADPRKPPIIDTRFLTHPQDMEDEVEMVSNIFKFYELSSMAKHLLPIKAIPGCHYCPDKRYIFECESYIRCAIEQMVYSTYHPAGTCRMGAVERKDAVVDPHLRVKGVSGLRVCDASVMPLLVNANTNAVSFMIGEKCAQIVKNDNKI